MHTHSLSFLTPYLFRERECMCVCVCSPFFPSSLKYVLGSLLFFFFTSHAPQLDANTNPCTSWTTQAHKHTVRMHRHARAHTQEFSMYWNLTDHASGNIAERERERVTGHYRKERELRWKGEQVDENMFSHFGQAVP